MPFTFQPMPHKDARDRIAGLPLVTRGMMDEMLPELRAYAFCITGLDVGDELAKVRDEIAAVPMGAKTWAQARKSIAADLTEGLGGKKAERRAELLLRTHVFRGYAAARYRNLMQQVDVFPYWQYKTHGDGNVRPSHLALNRKIFPAGHDIWQRIFPPWDWGCRCLVVPLTRGAVERMQAGGMAGPEQDGSLIKTQISKPELFTGREADLIAQAQKLPDGTPLNHAQTWASAPWSIPGNIRHDWPLIQKRYADQPEVLEAFKDWAKAQEIEPGVTVSMWLGDGVATKKAAKKVKGVKEVKVSTETIAAESTALMTSLGYPAAKVDYRGADLAGAKAMHEALSEHLADFPELGQKLGYYGTSTAQGAWVAEAFTKEAEAWADSYLAGFSKQDAGIIARRDAMIKKFLSRKMIRAPKACAFYSRNLITDGADRMVVNPKTSKPSPAEFKAQEECFDSGWWPKTLKGISPQKAVVTHELGHGMDSLLRLRKDPEILRIWNAKVKPMRRMDAINDLSVYGASQPAEMIAEAWAEFRLAPNPRPLAKEIGELILKRYEAKFPKTKP